MSESTVEVLPAENSGTDDDIGSVLDSTTGSSGEDESFRTEKDSTAKQRVRPRKEPVQFNQPAMDIFFEGSMDRTALQSLLDQPMDNWNGLTLTADQLQLVRRVVEALEKTYKVHSIRSEPGSGKTVCTFVIAYLLRLRVLVIRPRRVTSWKEEAQRYGFEIETELGYEELRSVRGRSNPKHGLLRRVDAPLQSKKSRSTRSESSSSSSSDSGSSSSSDSRSSQARKRKKKIRVKYPKPEFFATQDFLRLLHNGILLVLDESHRAKKNSERTLALSALVNCLVNTPGHRSRCLFLSGTQFDLASHVQTVCRSMGLIESNQVNLTDSRLVQFARLFQPEHRLIQPNVVRSLYTVRERLKFIYRVFIHILSPRLSSATPKLQIPVNMDVRIGFYRMPKDDELLIRESMLRWNMAIQQPGRFPKRLSEMTRAVHQTQLAKVQTVVRLVKNVFDENPGASVCVMGTSIDALDAIAFELQSLFTWTEDERNMESFVPVSHVLSGRMKPCRQQRVIEEFQNGKCSILVANLEVGGEGLNLQDRVGNRASWVFILPSHHATSMLQGIYRFYRLDTKSDVVVRLVFCRSKNRLGVDVHREKALLDNHKKKDRVWRDLMPQQDEAGAQFLAGLEMFYEE